MLTISIAVWVELYVCMYLNNAIVLQINVRFAVRSITKTIDTRKHPVREVVDMEDGRALSYAIIEQSREETQGI